MNAFHKARGREISCRPGFCKTLPNLPLSGLCLFAILQGSCAGLLPEETDEE